MHCQGTNCWHVIFLVGDGHQLTDSSGKLQLLQLWDSTESLKFLSQLFEAIEELRLRRVCK